MNYGLSPLRNFGVLEEGKLYRSAQPLYDYEYLWLKNMLGIKGIVNLRSEARIDNKHAPKVGITVFNIDVCDHKTPTIDQAKLFINIVTSNSPLLFHCEHGHGRTSTFAVIARISQKWTLQEALQEEEEVFNYIFKHPNQLQWLKDMETILKTL